MKNLLLIIALVFITGSAFGQLKKGNLVGVHVFTTELKSGVSMDQYLVFFEKNWIPEAEKTYNAKIYITKGIRGVNENSFGMIMVFNSEADRDKFYNADGSNTALGKSASDQMQPITTEAEEKYGTFTSNYTDWIIQ
jgi:DNA integrity scanning protein DisA with diadenylate cyclase activity